MFSVYVCMLPAFWWINDFYAYWYVGARSSDDRVESSADAGPEPRHTATITCSDPSPVRPPRRVTGRRSSAASAAVLRATAGRRGTGRIMVDRRRAVVPAASRDRWPRRSGWHDDITGTRRQRPRCDTVHSGLPAAARLVRLSVRRRRRRRRWHGGQSGRVSLAACYCSSHWPVHSLVQTPSAAASETTASRRLLCCQMLNKQHEPSYSDRYSEVYSWQLTATVVLSW